MQGLKLKSRGLAHEVYNARPKILFGQDFKLDSAQNLGQHQFKVAGNLEIDMINDDL